MGSFRQMTLTEKMADPQAAVVPETVPVTTKAAPELPFAVPRPQTSAEMFARQGSFRAFPTLNETVSPFKRQLSLRINDLPSNVQRRQRSNTANALTIPENEILNTDDINQESETVNKGLTTESANAGFSLSSSVTCPTKLSNYQSNNNIGNGNAANVDEGKKGITNTANDEEDSPIESFDPFNAHWAARLAKEESAKTPLSSNQTLTVAGRNSTNPFAQDVTAITFEVKL